MKFTFRSSSGLIPWNNSLAEIDQVVDQFLAVASLKHPNIVEHFGLDVHLGVAARIYLAMEYCSGGTLFDRSRLTNGLSENDIRRYSRQIIKGLAYIHQLGICHLDIKGQNILLTKDGVIKIGDFGEIVKLQSATQTRLKEVSPYVGTLRYMAPEMVNPDLVPRGRAADIYSFGCVLIEMITGQQPQYKHSTRGYLRDEILLVTFISNGGGPDMPLPERVPPDIYRMMQECLNRQPHVRPLAQQLEQDTITWPDNGYPLPQEQAESVLYSKSPKILPDIIRLMQRRFSA